MADTKISALPAVVTPGESDIFVAVQSSITKNITRNQMRKKYIPVVKSRNSGDITLNNVAPPWADLDTNLDLVLTNVAAGDIVEVSMASSFVNEAVAAYMDVASLVAGSEVTYWGTGTTESATSQGVLPWFGLSSAFTQVSGSVMRAVGSGDLESGQLTLRFRYRTGTAANRTLNASSEQVLHVWAKNHGQ